MTRTTDALTEATTLIAILRRIPRGRWISSSELAQRLSDDGVDVPTRRLQRALSSLVLSSDMNVEVDKTTKPYRYRRGPDVSDLATTRLTPREALTLRLCEEHLKHQLPPYIARGMASLFDAAKDVLHEDARSEKARAWLNKVAFVSPALPVVPPAIDGKVFETVSEALFRGSLIEIKYVNTQGHETVGTVSPLGLVQQDSRLYLVCVFENYDDVRHLALHRMKRAHLLERQARRPEGFSLEAYVTSRHFNYSNGQKIELIVEFTSDVTARNLRETPFRAEQELTKLPDGWRLRAVLDDTPAVDGWLAMWRDAAGIRLVEKRAWLDPMPGDAAADAAFRTASSGEAAGAADPALPAQAEPSRKPVVIVGGAGGMGKILQAFFRRHGHPVRILERDDWPRAREILAGAGIVVVSVPIDVTIAVIKQLGPLLDPDTLLCDVTSVKRAPVEAMLKAHTGPVLGMHPMFGPDVVDLARQVFVYVRARCPEASEELRRDLLSEDVSVVECSAADHDRSMSIIQALRHFTTYAYGVFLSKIRPDLRQILALSSPIYRLELEMVGRLFAQDPRLYADIVLSSEANADIIRAYVESLAPELDMVLRRDRDAFISRFMTARGWFGGWADTAMKESGRMLALVQAERRRQAEALKSGKTAQEKPQG